MPWYTVLCLSRVEGPSSEQKTSLDVRFTSLEVLCFRLEQLRSNFEVATSGVVNTALCIQLEDAKRRHICGEATCAEMRCPWG